MKYLLFSRVLHQATRACLQGRLSRSQLFTILNYYAGDAYGRHDKLAKLIALAPSGWLSPVWQLVGSQRPAKAMLEGCSCKSAAPASNDWRGSRKTTP